MMQENKKRIAIIGAGVAGLVTLRHAISHPGFRATIFEQTNQIGGTWVYTDETDFDKNGLPVHSSMYKNLRTNLPKEIMGIPDFPFADKSSGESYVHHSEIRQYLLNYADHFDLYRHVKFNCYVQHVEPKTLSNGKIKWIVRYMDLWSQRSCVQNFDAVVVCNGRYTVGHIPNIPGIEQFTGNRIHSHQYRVPEVYENRKVCILGASYSGVDICMEVAKFAQKVYLSHDLPDRLDSKMSSNVEQRAGISYVKGDKFYFKDGTTAQIDDLIYCTGYEFSYPFLSSKVCLSTKDNHVEPIYKFLIHIDCPNLFFLGLATCVIPFLMFHLQAQYAMEILEGNVKLPSSEQMHRDFEAEKKRLLDSGVNIRHISKVGDRQWEYYNEIAAAAKVPSFLPVVRKIYDHVSKMRGLDLTNYKNYQYRIVDEDNFVCIPR